MKKNVIKICCLILTMAILALGISVCVFGTSNLSPDLNISYCNLSFENEVYVMYAIKSSDANVKLLIWDQPQAEYVLGTQKITLSPLAEQMNIEGQMYTVFKYDKLVAKQMTDVIYARACISEGGNESYGDAHKYSILQYAYNKLGKTGIETSNTKLKNMLNKMLEYGASVQEYHDYKTDRLATDTFAQVKLTEGTLSDGFAHGLYRAGETVTINAPATNAQGVAFSQWVDKNNSYVANTAQHNLTVGMQNNVYTPQYAVAATPSNLEFESFGDGTCCVIGMGSCTDTDIVIPSKSPDGDTVIVIDSGAFSGEAITSVTIPASIEEIGRNAFSNCTSLTDVYFDGTEDDWNLIDIKSTGNTALTNATKHFKAAATFTVTFKDWNGTVLKTQSGIASGASATAPAEPTRDGYRFNGWDKAFDNVTSDLTVTATYVVDYSGPTIAVEKKTANKGETVQVPVMLYNTPDIAAMSLKIEFDESALSLASVTNGAALSSLNYIPSASLTSGGVWNWLDTSLAGTPEDGLLMTLTFNVLSNASEGDHLVKLSYSSGSILDKNENPLNINIVNENITVFQ